MTIHEKLLAIQSSLSVPKGQMNKFGGYKYRSCEDILEALKPLLKQNGLVLTLTDEIYFVSGGQAQAVTVKEYSDKAKGTIERTQIIGGDRFYVKATATLGDGENDVIVNAYAREEQDKRGMDGSQITGAASSYARKYALNGLFCIDDTKDADATNKHDKDEEPKPKSIPRKVAPADDEAGGAVIKDEKQFMDADEIKEVQKQRIKDLLVSFGQEGLTKAEAKAFIKEQTQLDISKDDWATIITRLEATLDDTDPLAEALKA